MRILIVKTSALGDIVQAFNVLDYLHSKWPDIEVDWAVERSLASLVSAHPLVRRTIPLDIKGLKKSWHSWKRIFSEISELRRERYDVLFDLQGNCKSAIVTALARAKVKVGFGWRTVREKPNVLATSRRFNPPRDMNIRLQLVQLIQSHFEDTQPVSIQGVRFKISPSDQTLIQTILAQPTLAKPMRIMVCPGSKWTNKQLSVDTLVSFLQRLQERLEASFLLMWGSEEERELCQTIHDHFPSSSRVIDKLAIPTWQNLMNEMQLVLAVDSSALHLCGTTQTPSFSLFGPTSPHIFKPIGPRHYAYQGPCPYGRTFPKACPALRTCPTGACLRNLSADVLFDQFIGWWENLSN